MRTISQDTILRLKEMIMLLVEKPVTIDEIVFKTSIPNSTTAHKLIAKLGNDYGFNVIVSKVNRRAQRCGTRLGVYSICATQHDKARKVTDDELGKRTATANLPVRIQALMKGGYSIDYICASLDKTRSCILYHATKNNIDTTIKRDKKTPDKPVVTENDLLTIYMPRPKILS
jgi:hypothetical protein